MRSQIGTRARLLAVQIGMVLVAGCTSGVGSGGGGSGGEEVPPRGPGDAAAGRVLYEANGCGGCHGDPGMNNPALADAPDIGGEDPEEAQYIEMALTDVGHPGGTFVEFTGQDYEDLAAFLAQGGGEGGGSIDSWSLWTEGTRLRGANIWQSINYVELHGEGTLGDGPVGPPFTQDDSDQLAALGANYVNISHPGLFTEKPPYELDEGVQNNLDSLLRMIAQADMFAVITFRTGPGRSEFWAVLDEDTANNPEEGWFDPSYYNHTVWTDDAAQAPWADMWRHTADRYKDNAVVVGYDLMCEPNSEEIFFDIWGEPEEFYPDQAGTTYDWNQFYPDIVAAIREVDVETPILVQPMGYGSAVWLPYLDLSDDARIVYTVHQYEPANYTHQSPPLDLAYPGRFDADHDGADDEVNQAWLDNVLVTVDDFVRAHGVPVAVNEYGPMRWEPGADRFMDELMDLFEQRGMSHALWEWSPSWEPFAWNDAFNFRHGPDPENHANVESSDLLDVIVDHWGRNTVRPSNVTLETGGDSWAPSPRKRTARKDNDRGEPDEYEALLAGSWDVSVDPGGVRLYRPGRRGRWWWGGGVYLGRCLQRRRRLHCRHLLRG